MEGPTIRRLDAVRIPSVAAGSRRAAGATLPGQPVRNGVLFAAPELPVNIALPAAIFAGVLIAVQVTIIGAFGDRLSPFVVAFWLHVGGLAFGFVGVLVTRLGFGVADVRQAPWVMLAGVAGMLLLTGIAVAIGGLGLASTLAVVTGVQLVVGFAIESSGLLGKAATFDPVRLAGAALLVAGVYLVASRSPGVA